jgi:peroxiredoxin
MTGTPTPASDIGPDFVPRPRDSVTSREMGGETVLLDGVSGAVYRLDAVGSVVWSTFDGSAELGVLVKELADAFAADAEVVGRDVLDLTRTLAHIGLLADIAPPAAHEHGHDHGQAPPPATAEGDELPPFRLPDLDGGVVDLADLRGGPVLLVNWSPGCGYCVMIAAELHALRADMAERGTRLLLVAAGDAESNRALLADLDVDLPVVLRAGADDDFADPFLRMGTPAAYLLDADGRVAAPLVSGAYQVPTLARLAAGKVSPPTPVGMPARYAPGAADGMCGAGSGATAGGGAKAARPRTWTPTVAYRVGEYHLGVRADTPAAADIVRRFLAAHHVGDDPNVAANFSVVLGAGSDAGGGRQPARDLKLLLQASASVVRSRSSGRVLAGLASFLAAYVPDEGTDGLLRTRNLALVVDGEAVLVPPAVRGAVEQLQPRIARYRAQLVDEPSALLDPVRRELVVAEPALTLDWSVLDELPVPAPSRSEPAAVVPGRYPLRAWAMWDSGVPDAPELTPAEALTQALTTLAVPPGRLLAAADLLADLLAATPPVVLATTGGDIADQLRPYLTVGGLRPPTPPEVKGFDRLRRTVLLVPPGQGPSGRPGG